MEKISNQFKGAVCKNNPVDMAKAGSIQKWSIPYTAHSFSFRLGGTEKPLQEPAACDLPFALQQLQKKAGRKQQIVASMPKKRFVKSIIRRNSGAHEADVDVGIIQGPG